MSSERKKRPLPERCQSCGARLTWWDNGGCRPTAEVEVEHLRARCARAANLLRAAYDEHHPEDVPMDVLAWLNPGALGEA